MQPTLVRYSSIAAFKACPNRYRLAFVENLVPEREPATTRMGSNWHAMHECYADAAAKWVPINEDETHAPEDARKEHAWAAVYELLNQRYAEVPAWLTADEWALERQILLVSFQAYQWYFQNDPIEFLASEVVFRLPLHNPKLGLPLPMTEVQREGHIDHIVRWQNGVCILERKSTSKSLAPDSDFWQRWAKDDQISQYSLAFRDMLPYANAITAAVYGPFFELPLSQGMVAFVDEADRTLVEQHAWHAWTAEGKLWYAATNIKEDGKYRATRLHQLLMGEIGEDERIDHINRNSLDNRRCNLRIVPHGVNRMNADTRGTHQVSANRWVARIMKDYQSRVIGYYESEEEAHRAYVAAQAELLPQPTTRQGNTLLDVWHKPSIKPAMLTQKETAEFIASGEYCGQTFEVSQAAEQQGSWLTVDGVTPVIEQGKKGFAIKETIEMFGARLLKEYCENPTRYFVRREIARTDAEIRDFQASLWAVYQTQAAMRRSGNWYGNYSQCRATFACPFIPICYGPGADAVSDGTTTPSGFKRQKFVDLTVNGRAVGEEE